MAHGRYRVYRQQRLAGPPHPNPQRLSEPAGKRRRQRHGHRRPRPWRDPLADLADTNRRSRRRTTRTDPGPLDRPRACATLQEELLCRHYYCPDPRLLPDDPDDYVGQDR